VIAGNDRQRGYSVLNGNTGFSELLVLPGILIRWDLRRRPRQWLFRCGVIQIAGYDVDMEVRHDIA